MSKMKCKRLCVMLTLSLLLVCMMGTTAFAAGTGDVAGAVESTWATASTQINTVVNNVVFPAIDGSRHPVRVPRVHADGTAVHLADYRNLRCRQ